MSDNERVVADLTAGERYYINVYGFGSSVSYDLSITTTAGEYFPDRFEENDTFIDNTFLGVADFSRENDLTIDAAGDDDWYAIAVNDNAVLTVDIAFDHADGDLNIELFGNNGQPVPGGNSITDNESDSVQGFTGGRYLFRVYGVNGATNEYDMRVYLSPAADRFEPNDQLATATNFGPLGTRFEGNLSISSSDDIDAFRFEATSTGAVVVDALFDHSDGRDLDLALLDADGNILDRSVTTSDNERVVSPVTAGQVYFAVVGGFDGNTNAYNLSIDATYALVPDAFEDNDTLQTAADLGVVTSRNIFGATTDRAGDEDWYAFTSSFDGTATVDAIFDFVGGDLNLGIFDEAGNTIVAQDVAGSNEQVVFDVFSDNRYFIRVDTQVMR